MTMEEEEGGAVERCRHHAINFTFLTIIIIISMVTDAVGGAELGRASHHAPCIPLKLAGIFLLEHAADKQ